jgi:catechol 2,3-dioxygenase-like lactoylglutathione lyase family enzyme
MSETTTTSINTVGRVMIPVADQDRAIDFYVNKLGMEKIADTPFGDGNRWVEVRPAGSTTALALVAPRPDDPVGIQTNVALDSSDVEGDHAALKAAGVDVDDEVMRMGGPVPPMFFFRDADGNTLLLVEPTEA